MRPHPKHDLIEIFAVAAENAARIFKDTGEFAPMWHAVDRDDENLLIATPWKDSDEKHAIVAQLRKLFRAKGVKRYVFMCEAWSIETTEQRLADDLSYVGNMSEHPDRREILAISAEDRDGAVMHGWFYILRPEHGPAKLSPLQMSKADHQEGALQGMLK